MDKVSLIRLVASYGFNKNVVLIVSTNVYVRTFPKFVLIQQKAFLLSLTFFVLDFALHKVKIVDCEGVHEAVHKSYGFCSFLCNIYNK